MQWRRVLLLILVLTLAFLVFAAWQTPILTQNSHTQIHEFGPGQAFVYLFDAETSSFVFTFTHPELGVGLWDVEALSESEVTKVWFTEPGADRIGELTYASSQEPTYRSYALPNGSYPLNLAAKEQQVWFTMPGRNSIGRLDRSSRTIAEFPIPTSGSYPADLDVANDGSVWFTEQKADQIGHLVVTTTTHYRIQEYRHPGIVGGHPYGIDVVQGSPAEEVEVIFFAQPANHKVTWFRPSDSTWIDISGPVLDEPYKIVAESWREAWGTDRTGNAIDKFSYDTFPQPLEFPVQPAHSHPFSLIIASTGDAWFTQYGAGQIGCLDLSSKNFCFHSLPIPDLSPTGIAEGGSGELWILANRLDFVFLPLISSK